MDTKASISEELTALYNEGVEVISDLQSDASKNDFTFEYQNWYTKAIRVVELLANDRLSEFKSYYEIDPKRKTMGYGTYYIQDFLKDVAPNKRKYPEFNTRNQTVKNFMNQLAIVNSLIGRISSILSNIDIELMADIQDAELETARRLIKVSLRAAGSLTGVIIENHLQKLAKIHKIPLKKKNPTISDLNDPLKNAGIFDTPTWRKVTYLADIRNICSHKKDIEPTKEQVNELIEGANWLIKNTF
jgi:hypothetical protein